MDKKKLLSKKEKAQLLEKLTELANSRNYVARNMTLDVKAVDKENKITEVRGELVIKVTEDATKDDSWKDAKFSVIIFDDKDKLGMTVMKVVANLYSISNDYGDAMFEDGFYSVLSGEVDEPII